MSDTPRTSTTVSTYNYTTTIGGRSREVGTRPGTSGCPPTSLDLVRDRRVNVDPLRLISVLDTVDVITQHLPSSRVDPPGSSPLRDSLSERWEVRNRGNRTTAGRTRRDYPSANSDSGEYPGSGR